MLSFGWTESITKAILTVGTHWDAGLPHKNTFVKRAPVNALQRTRRPNAQPKDGSAEETDAKRKWGPTEP